MNTNNLSYLQAIARLSIVAVSRHPTVPNFHEFIPSVAWTLVIHIVRQALNPFLFSYISLCLCLSVSLCLSLSVSVYLSLPFSSLSLSLSLSLCLSLSVSVYLCLSFSLSLSLCLCLSLSIFFSLSLFLSLSLCLSRRTTVIGMVHMPIKKSTRAKLAIKRLLLVLRCLHEAIARITSVFPAITALYI